MDTLEDQEVPVQERGPATDPSLELRVLTGLQAGAALPLDQPLLAGRAEDCDLLLLDDLAPPHWLELTPTEGGAVTLTPLCDGLMMSDGSILTGPVSLSAGHVFGMEGLWLEVQSCDAPWPAPSEASALAQSRPDPSDVDAWAGGADGGGDIRDDRQSPFAGDAAADVSAGAAHDTAHGAAATAAHPGAQGAGTAGHRDPAIDFGDWMMDAQGEDSPWQVDPSERRSPKAPVTDTRAVETRRRWLTWGVMGIGGMLTISGLVAMAVQWREATLPADATPDAVADRAAVAPTRAADPPTRAAQARLSAASTPALTTPSEQPEPKAPPERPGRVRVTGGVTIVRADTDIVLPFEVREVVLGARSRVVLSNGQTLLPGDAVGIWRLMEIKAGTLVFEGPQRVLLPW